MSDAGVTAIQAACAGFQNFFSFFGFDRLTGKSLLAIFGFFGGAASIIGEMDRGHVPKI